MAQPLTGLPLIDAFEDDDELWAGDASEPPGSKDKRGTVGQLRERVQAAYFGASDPGASDDETQGYRILSMGLNVSTDAVFICIDPSEGAAVWLQLAVES